MPTFTVSFLVGRVPLSQIDYRKKGRPYSNLSTGEPSSVSLLDLKKCVALFLRTRFLWRNPALSYGKHRKSREPMEAKSNAGTAGCLPWLNKSMSQGKRLEGPTFKQICSKVDPFSGQGLKANRRLGVLPCGVLHRLQVPSHLPAESVHFPKARHWLGESRRHYSSPFWWLHPRPPDRHGSCAIFFHPDVNTGALKMGGYSTSQRVYLESPRPLTVS